MNEFVIKTGETMRCSSVGCQLSWCGLALAVVGLNVIELPCSGSCLFIWVDLSTTADIMVAHSAAQLMSFNNCTTPSCASIIRQLGLLCRPHYVHRCSCRKFVYSQSYHTIPSIWTAERTGVSCSHRLNAAALGTCSPRNMAALLHRGWYGKLGMQP